MLVTESAREIMGEGAVLAEKGFQKQGPEQTSIRFSGKGSNFAQIQNCRLKPAKIGLSFVSSMQQEQQSAIHVVRLFQSKEPDRAIEEIKNKSV